MPFDKININERCRLQSYLTTVLDYIGCPVDGDGPPCAETCLEDGSRCLGAESNRFLRELDREMAGSPSSGALARWSDG